MTIDVDIWHGGSSWHHLGQGYGSKFTVTLGNSSSSQGECVVDTAGGR